MGTLTDAGVLFSLTDRHDQHHRACVDAVQKLGTALITTWPCIAESMYLLGTRLGWRAQDALWRLLESEHLIVHDITPAERARMRALMTRFRDLPMDLADASLVAAAETRRLRRILTLDSHFRIYRLNDKESFEIIP